ncbi:MAG: biotin transporter BioY [Chlamydiales bacterium]
MELTFPRIAKENTWLKEASIILGASIFIALCAPFSIRLPFNPVPIVLQNHIILLMAAFLGSRRATLAVLAFLAQALVGLPVLASGKIGILAFTGPTGGYLIGYIAAAYVVGRLVERRKNPGSIRAIASFLAGSLCVFFFGVMHLASFIGFEKALLVGVVPFIPCDLIKTIVCVRLLKGFSSQEPLA